MKKTILAITQDETMVEFLQKGLNGGEYEVVNTRHKEIRRLAETIIVDEPGFIILDIMMPTLDGIGICLGLRDRCSKIPIMMLTTWKASGGVRGLNLGSNNYLTETFGIDLLKKRMEEAIKLNLHHVQSPGN